MPNHASDYEVMLNALDEILALADNDYVNRHASIWRVAKDALDYVGANTQSERKGI